MKRPVSDSVWDIWSEESEKVKRKKGVQQKLDSKTKAESFFFAFTFAGETSIQEHCRMALSTSKMTFAGSKFHSSPIEEELVIHPFFPFSLPRFFGEEKKVYLKKIPGKRRNKFYTLVN